MSMLFERSASQRVRDAIGDTPVVAIVGPRQCGKSTLALEFAEGRKYLTLDDPVHLAHAKENPADFLKAHGAPLIIDEIQRAPELFLPLKLMVDKHRTPGSYILTGSANVLLLPKIADSLAGRMEVIDLLPLSQAEIEGRKSNWVDNIFSNLPTETEASDTILSRVLRGGFPEPVVRASKRRDAWFQSYVRTLLDRDVRDLANIDGLTQLPKLLRLIASRAGEPLNLSSFSRETGLPHTTLTRYVDLLQALYLIHMVPAWSSDIDVRLARTPKAYLIDSGLAGYLNQTDERSLSHSEALRKSLVETYLASELKKAILTAEETYELFHLRTVKNKEVAFLIEARDGRVVAIDVRDEEVSGVHSTERIDYVQEIVGDKFHRGVVLNYGNEAHILTTKISAVSILSL
jgi:predicted AAA+ superfamily ATPase